MPKPNLKLRPKKTEKWLFFKIWKDSVSVFKHDTRTYYSCQICRFYTPNRLLSRVHTRRLHTPISLWPQACSKCGARFPLKTELRCHQFVAHPGDSFENLPVECLLCHRRFPSEQAKKRHQWVHKKKKVPEDSLTCQKCDVVFSNKYNLKVHTSLSHASPPITFECRDCHKLFKSANSLKTHSNIHTKNQSYSCDHSGCDRVFYSRASFKNHVKSHCLTYSCSQCHKSFCNKQNLRRHQIVHKELSKFGYQCTFCSKFFTQNSSRKRHEKIHTKEKNYHCLECDFRTGDPSVLHRHTMKHKKYNPAPQENAPSFVLQSSEHELSNVACDSYQIQNIVNSQPSIEKVHDVPLILEQPDSCCYTDTNLFHSNSGDLRPVHQSDNVINLPNLSLVLNSGTITDTNRQPVNMRIIQILDNDFSATQTVPNEIVTDYQETTSSNFVQQVPNPNFNPHCQVPVHFQNCPQVIDDSLPICADISDSIFDTSVHYAIPHSRHQFDYHPPAININDFPALDTNQLVLIDNSHLVDIDSLTDILTN